jgi:thermopsin
MARIPRIRSDWASVARLLFVSGVASVLLLSAFNAIAVPSSGHPTGAPAGTGGAATIFRGALDPPARSAVAAAPELKAREAAEQRALGLSHVGGLAPNLAYSAVREGGALVPTNLLQGGVSPGPTSIGVNDLGLRTNASGAYVAYSYRTTSLEGTVTINNVSLLPIENNASNSLTLQLNAILNNVTIYGQSIYQIWAQNVIFYSVEGDQMQLATDAWNFSGAPYELFQNDIYRNSPGGFIFTGTYVHAVPSQPPAWTLEPPFSISFYLNATNVAGRNALYFN